jgi:hypothetical protein
MMNTNTMAKTLTAIRMVKAAKADQWKNFRIIAERETDVDEAARALKVRVSNFAIKNLF